MIDLKTKQAFWAEQLPLFKEKYWIPEHLDVLEFDMIGGCFEIPVDVKSDLSEDDLFDTYHRVNSGWAMWKKSVTFMQEKAKVQTVPTKSRYVYLNCNQLKQALKFGAPDLFQVSAGKNDDIEFQLETEMAIEFIENGHSGSGYYCWYSDLPEEGSIKLEIESGASP